MPEADRAVILGRDTHKAYFCKRCLWRSPAMRLGWAMENSCPECSGGLSFVNFSLDELEEAEKIAGGKLNVEEAMEIKLQHGHKIVDADSQKVPIVTTHDQTVVLSHADVVKLFKAINGPASRDLIAAAARQGSPSGTEQK